ncbi:glycine oxidase ThiO [Neptunomonas qingdaonensis]|uniref:Glycine oxidase n=1 Tax=Neptunomonas qingdaonensis TaxID=1045558 RepID=A0A1I2VLS4_9GAMM|nr:glycine oxidase ThiO [Neptunomonas qingdaonensis]SFG89187.1 glycine oxidase [Neptunomonas qingdaonensis]
MSDFVIVGAGVIGMMLARELMQAGATVSLVDRSACAQEATWAGGGIVSPLYPWRYSDPVTQLATWSQSSYLHLSQDLIEETGCDPELRQKGMYMVDVEDEQDALSWAAQFNRPMSKVGASHLYAREANFCRGYQSALWMPEVCSIRNPRLGKSLRASLEKSPRVTLYEHHDVHHLLLDNDKVHGVRTAQGDINGGKTIITAGAWSAELLKPLDINLPVEPVKGQMMIFKTPVGTVNRVILMAGRYVIPRNDGRVLVGSTLEREGFDKHTTQGAYQSLHQTAIQIIPALAKCEVEHHWAGLRPGSPEGIPFIGDVPGVAGLAVNAGQYRNGLVLAPASTRMHADMLLGREPVVNPAAYQLEGRI